VKLKQTPGVSRVLALEFERRAARYQALDVLLKHKTRFFAAAAAVNATMAEATCIAGVAWFMPAESIAFLAELGAFLERHNAQFAALIPQMPIHGSLLDDQLVSREQQFVEQKLAHYPACVGRALVRGVDRLLWANATLTPRRPTSAGKHLLAHAMREARIRRGEFSFGNLADRERIGCLLVRHIRRLVR